MPQGNQAEKIACFRPVRWVLRIFLSLSKLNEMLFELIGLIVPA